MASASRPPTMKKNSAVAAYMMPSFLWSTVNSHDFHPVVSTGRRNTPYVVDGVATAGTSARSVGRSISAMVRSLPLQEVCDQLVDLVLGQPQVGHAAELTVGRLQFVGVGVHRLLARCVPQPLTQIDLVEALGRDALQVGGTEVLRGCLPHVLAAVVGEQVPGGAGEGVARHQVGEVGCRPGVHPLVGC